MKILKKFENYIKEDLEMDPEINEVPTEDLDVMDDDSTEQMPKEDMSEEEEEYIGTKLLQDLADELGTEVVNNKVEFEGKVINFYSETEKFHIGNKKFSTVKEVVDFLKGDHSEMQNERFSTKFRKTRRRN
jgi:hypothetical protein